MLPPFLLIHDFGKHPQKRFQNFCQSCVLSTDQIEIHQSQPANICKKVTLVAVIGGFRSDLSIARKTDGNLETFPRVFCFPKSRINENGGN